AVPELRSDNASGRRKHRSAGRDRLSAERRLESVRRSDAGAVSDSYPVAAPMRGRRLWTDLPNLRESPRDGTVFGLRRAGLRPLRAGQSAHGVLQPAARGVRATRHRGPESLAAADFLQWTGVPGWTSRAPRADLPRNPNGGDVPRDSGLHRAPLGAGHAVRADVGGPVRRYSDHTAAGLHEERRPIPDGRQR